MGEINQKGWKRIIDADGIPSLLVPMALSEDYDGCFGNTNEAMRIVENIVDERTHLTVNDIRTARFHIESQMLPFSAVDYLQRELVREGKGKTWQKDIKPYLVERAARPHHRDRLLTVGSRAVFAVARENGMPEVVLTHGAVAPPYGPEQEWAAWEWQTSKVQITPEMEDKTVVVTHEPVKSLELSSWFDNRVGLFRLPNGLWLRPDEPLYAESVVHIDDKRSALQKWPQNIPLYAIHYLPEREEDIRQTQVKGELPAGVPVARGMGQVACRLQELYENVA